MRITTRKDVNISKILFFTLKSPKVSHLRLLGLFPIISVSADEYKFEEIKFDQVENKQDIYEPKDKLDEYIIKAATYSTKFVPLINNGADDSEYTNLMANDGKKLLVDAGYDFVNSAANSEIQKIPFFAQTTVNISGGTESDTSFSLKLDFLKKSLIITKTTH